MTHGMISQEIRFMRHGLYCSYLLDPDFSSSRLRLLWYGESEPVIVIGTKHLSSDSLKKEMEFIGGGVPVPVKHGTRAKGPLIDQIHRLLSHHRIWETK